MYCGLAKPQYGFSSFNEAVKFFKSAFKNDIDQLENTYGTGVFITDDLVAFR